MNRHIQRCLYHGILESYYILANSGVSLLLRGFAAVPKKKHIVEHKK